MLSLSCYKVQGHSAYLCTCRNIHSCRTCRLECISITWFITLVITVFKFDRDAGWLVIYNIWNWLRLRTSGMNFSRILHT